MGGIWGFFVETISGSIEKIAFHNPESGFFVIKVQPKDKREPLTVVGAHPVLAAGEEVVCTGEWHTDPSFGQQFRAESIRATTPVTLQGIRKYLASGAIRGVGPKFADKLIEHFGKQVLEAIEAGASTLMTVPGVGPAKAAALVEGWAQQRAVKEIMMFLHSNGVPTAMASKIYKTYGDKAMEIINENPYRLAQDVRGIGFKSADAIAMNLGVLPTSPPRIRAGLVHLIQEATTSGHCGQPRQTLVPRAVETLGVPVDLVQRSLDAELALDPKRRYLVQHGDGIYLAAIAACEERVATTLADMASWPVPWKIDADKAIEEAQKELGFTLAEQQYAGVKMMLTNRVSVFTGGPGTGKTASLNLLLHVFRKHRIPVHLAAPTGKAAQRAAEVTGMDASTIHRLLKLSNPGSEPVDVEGGVLVIDESSMIDIYLMNNVVKAARGVPLILVGDVDQLPSVGPGQVLADIIASGAVPVTRLTQVFRQAAGSLIIRNAHNINSGLVPEKGTKEDDFFFLTLPEKDESGVPVEPSALGERITTTICDLVANRLPGSYGFDPIRDIMVLSPMNVTNTGVASLNAALQQRLNPKPEKSLTRFNTRFGVGDKVIQTRNNYDLDIFNGDVGIITSIDDEDASRLTVSFGGRMVEMPFDEMDALRLAYCITIHKSQGSQAEAVVIPVTTQHFTMLQRNLFYTGVTRARKLVVLVGSPRAMALAVKNDGAMKRVTRLKNLLAVARGAS